jgi:hypothetical protein
MRETRSRKSQVDGDWVAVFVVIVGWTR